MAHKLSEVEWAKVRHDRIVKKLSFGELAEKYGIGKATIHRKAKADGWENIETAVSPKTSRSSSKKPIGNIKPNCLQDEPVKPKSKVKVKPEPKYKETPRDKPSEEPLDDEVLADGDDTDEISETRSERWDRIRSERIIEKQSGTTNGTEEQNNFFQNQIHVGGLKNSFDPSRARDQRFISFQLEQINEHLGDLSQVYESAGLGKYRIEFCRVAHSIALLGGTPETLAKSLGVSEQTVRNWLDTYPEFNIAWVGGKDFADAKVAEALFKRAVGFKEVVEDFKTEKGELVPIEKTIVFAPDVQAQQFWLKNRQPHNWKDKVEVQEEISIALPDLKAADAFYANVLKEAAGLKAQFMGRKERMNLVMDGEFQEID